MANVDSSVEEMEKKSNSNLMIPNEEHSLAQAVDAKKLLWKIDLHIVPWLTLLYLMNYLDRGTIGNAKLYNLEKDLGITDRQYLNGLTILFFPYAFIQPASNVFLRRLRPSIYLSGMMVTWGIVMTCHGLIHNYPQLLAIRFLMGLTEGGLYSGVIFYMSSWYKRSEMGTRIAVFLSAATVAGAFSGLLSAAISNMEGVGGKAAWQWMFILEGLATILIAVASFWILEDFPVSARFLTKDERSFVISRLLDDAKLSAGGESFSMKHVWMGFMDWQTWVSLGIFMGFDGPLFAFALFAPSIINQLGFRATEANLLSVPVYAWACLVTCAVGVVADRTRSRGYLNIIFLGIGLVGYIILIFSRSPALSYFAVFLAASAIYPVTANSASWVASNVEGSYKRAVILAIVIGFGNVNGAVTSNIYRAQDTPWYRLGHGIVLGYIAVGFLSSIFYLALLKRENACRDRGERDEVIEGVVNPLAHSRNGTYTSVDEAKADKGDKWSGFRYTFGPSTSQTLVMLLFKPCSFVFQIPGLPRSRLNTFISMTYTDTTSKDEKDGSGVLVLEESNTLTLSTLNEKKLLWKLDVHIVPWLSLLYLLSFLDRGSIGNAKLYNLEADLDITDRQYLIALTIFFIPYALIEPVSNVLLRRLRPSIYLSCIMVAWGIVMTCHGVVRNYRELLAVRFLLGLTEGGLYAGVIFYISSWYKRSEMGTRVAVFFSAATVAGAFSGLLAAAISNMDGIGGKAAWQWIFILEGLATVVIAFASFWIIQDFPTTARFLTEEERAFVVQRLIQDTKFSAGGEAFRKKNLWQSLKDWQSYVALGIFMGFDGPLYAFALFTPSIIKEATEANLLSVPVYAWACIVTCTIGVLGDRTASRGYINICFFTIGLIGYAILIASNTPALSYFAVFLAASAIYPADANSTAWVACNIEGSYKRAVTLAMAIGWGNLNGAVTSNIYRNQDAPRYRLGHSIVLGYIAVGFVSSCLYLFLLKKENASRERGERDEAIEGVNNPHADERNGVYASEEEAKTVKGDKWSGFRYTL